MFKFLVYVRIVVSIGMDFRGLREKGVFMNNMEENDIGRDEVFVGRVL